MTTTTIAIYNLEVIKQLPSSYTNLSVSGYSIEVLHPYSTPLAGEIPYTQYYFSGVVRENTTPISRELIAYSQDTYNEVGRTRSKSDGTFVLPSTTSTTCFIVCLDDNSSTQNYNHLIVAIIDPLNFNN